MPTICFVVLHTFVYLYTKFVHTHYSPHGRVWRHILFLPIVIIDYNINNNNNNHVIIVLFPRVDMIYYQDVVISYNSASFK